MAVDQHAEKRRSDNRGPTAARPSCSHCDVEIASLSLRGDKLTSQYKYKLKTQLHHKALTACIKEKEYWNKKTSNTFNWSTCGTDFKRLSKNRQINVSKACFNYWHTGARHTTFYQEERPCCFSNNKKEYWKHILTCGSLDANLNRAASWTKLKQSMEVWHLPNDFSTAMEKGVAHITNHEGTANNSPLPFTVSTHPGRMQLWEESKQQSKIEWINMLKGRLSVQWQDYVTAHLKATNSRLKADEWATKFVTALWEHTLRIWQLKNDAFHADNEVQTKLYKLEALGGNKAQTRARFVALHERLHEYKTTHFSHREIIDDLRYDSQCC
jgi:hypothetical protein